MRLNISFDEPASLRTILQPVSFVNVFAKLGSEYAGHSIRLSVPSPAPTEVGRPCDFETPTAGTSSAPTSTAAPASPRCQARMRFLTLPPPFLAPPSFADFSSRDVELHRRAPREPDPPAL